MIEAIKTLSKHSVIYGLGGVLNKLLAFVLLPIYTRYLTPADYGILSLLLVTGSVAFIIVQLGLGSALFREVIYCETDEKVATSTALYFLVVQALVLFGGLVVFSSPLSVLIFNTTTYAYLLRLVFLTGLFQVIGVIFMARLRIREQAALYSAFSVAWFLVGAGLNIYFIVILRQGVGGLITAGLIQAGLFAMIYLIFLIPDMRPVLAKPILRSMLLFGIPMVPAGLADLVMVSADRYFLQHYFTTTEVGLYSLGYTIGMVMNLVVWSVQLAWPAQMFTIAKQPDAERQFSRILTYYVLVLGFFFLALSLLARELLVVMTTPAFYGAAAIVPLVALSYLLYGVRYMTNTALPTRNKMQYVPIIIIGTALLNLGLNYLLIPSYGMMGAAWATAISYLTLAVVNTAINLHFWYIPYEYGRMAKVALAGVTVYGASHLVDTGNIWLNGGLKLVLLGLYPLILFVYRFYNESEVATLKALIFKRDRGV